MEGRGWFYDDILWRDSTIPTIQYCCENRAHVHKIWLLFQNSLESILNFYSISELTLHEGE